MPLRTWRGTCRTSNVACLPDHVLNNHRITQLTLVNNMLERLSAISPCAVAHHAAGRFHN